MKKAVNDKKVGVLTLEEVEHLKHWKKTSIKARLDFLQSALELGKAFEVKKH